MLIAQRACQLSLISIHATFAGFQAINFPKFCKQQTNNDKKFKSFPAIPMPMTRNAHQTSILKLMNQLGFISESKHRNFFTFAKLFIRIRDMYRRRLKTPDDCYISFFSTSYLAG